MSIGERGEDGHDFLLMSLDVGFCLELGLAERDGVEVGGGRVDALLVLGRALLAESGVLAGLGCTEADYPLGRVLPTDQA